MQLALDPNEVKGFLDADEGARLYDLAIEVSAHGPCLEVGSYCGKSTIYLASACREHGGVLFAVDHHRGSEEHQVGEAYHDPELYDAVAKRMDSFWAFRRTLVLAELEATVVPIVASSALVGRHWTTPLQLVFIDGGHSQAAALADYAAWSPHVAAGGYLAIHDVFPNPDDGGRAPYEIYQLALSSGAFEACEMTKTLGVLRRL